MTYSIGQRVKLTDHVGYNPKHNPDDPYEQFLDRHYPVFAGQVGTVDEVTPKGVLTDVDGNSPEHVTVRFDEHRTLVDHGNPDDGPTHAKDPSHGPRRVSFPADQMDNLFTEADK